MSRRKYILKYISGLIKQILARCVYSTSLVGMEIDMSLSCTVEAGEAGAQRNSQAKACYDSMAHYQP